MAVKHLSQDCRLYGLATEKFMRLAPDAMLHVVEIMGDGSIKITYEHEGDTDNWSIDVIHLVETQR